MIGASGGGARLILRKLREIMAAGEPAQARLDRLVAMIAATMVADVCSIYLRRGDHHELFATEGLRPDAVHRTKLRLGEGLVGLVAETARPLNLPDAPHHPRFSYRPETGEDPFMAFLGVPIVRSERVFGVLVVQNRAAKTYAEDEVEALQTIAMVLAEMVAAGNFGDLSAIGDVEARVSRPERLAGKVFSEGLAIGEAVLHEPHAPLGRMIADDPASEERRLDVALAAVRESLDQLAEGEAGRLASVSRDVLETFQLLARDRSWEQRLKAGVRSGLSAEAAVERARQEHRVRLQSARDPYLRDRLHDLEDLDNRLLRALSPDLAGGRGTLPENAILVARDLGAAELLEYDAKKLRGLALEEGGPSSHTIIVARALGLPVVGRAAGLLSRVESGDPLIVDGERGELQLRPGTDVAAAYAERIALRSAQAAELTKLRDLPARTTDGEDLELLLNAGLALDMQSLAEVGALGVGLFRTEFQFMVSETLPRLDAQTQLYRDVLDAAQGRPVTFRTLDLGGDKVLPYVTAEREDNPALGWRAIRMALDRPALLRYQLRALIAAAEDRPLRVMFPLVTVIEEVLAARELLERELAWARRHGRRGPNTLEVGAMVEAPALAFVIRSLRGKVDFLSIGTNDLMQYFFAADRGNPKVADRYDVLSRPALLFLQAIQADADAAGLPLSICGEAAGRPLEALALLGLGYRRLSMPGSGIGPVKRLVRSVAAADARALIAECLKSDKTFIRSRFAERAREIGAAV